MANAQSTTQYVLLPLQGAKFHEHEQRQLLSALDTTAAENRLFSYETSSEHPVQMRLLDSVREDGPRLVEMSPECAHDLQAHLPTMRVAPVVYYYPVAANLEVLELGIHLKTVIEVLSRDGNPIEGATVSWAGTRADGAPVQGRSVTDAQGVVRFPRTSAIHAQQLVISPDKDFWSLLKKDVDLSAKMTFELTPINLADIDGLRFFYKDASLTAGQGVSVGVIDTGIALHKDLIIDGGENTTGEDPNDFGDNGAGHGTHVAGIIAARGTPPDGIRGVAPGVTLRSYRVFEQGKEGASSFAIFKAVDDAVSDGCDLLNLSLGSQANDPVTELAVDLAFERGTVIIAAAGNDFRLEVDSPARHHPCIAVSAMGRIGTFPPDSIEQAEIADPRSVSPDNKNFIASFSNFGLQVDLTAPGVGIISTFPDGYAVLDGTSMASPAATGAAARILAQRPDILGMTRDQARSLAMRKEILSKARPQGFGVEFEGSGMLVVP